MENYGLDVAAGHIDSGVIGFGNVDTAGTKASTSLLHHLTNDEDQCDQPQEPEY